jgi:serine protease inhibitor
MMKRRYEEGELLYASAPGKFRAVRLPYRGGNFSAVVMLPDNFSTKPESLLPLLLGGGGLLAPLPRGSLVAAVGGGSVPGGWQAKRRAIVALPRFKLRASMSLSEPLRKLGVAAAFAPTVANFSRAEADPASPFYISDVVQEVCAWGCGRAAALACGPESVGSSLLVGAVV